MEYFTLFSEFGTQNVPAQRANHRTTLAFVRDQYHMAPFHDLTTAQLRQILQLREQIESLQQKLDAIIGGAGSSSTPKNKVGTRTMSPATIAKMRAGQQARWAHLKAAPANKSTPAKVAPKKKMMSPEAKAKMAAAMKARWEAKKGSLAPNVSRSQHRLQSARVLIVP